MVHVAGDKSYTDCSVKIGSSFSAYSLFCNRDNSRRFFVFGPNGAWDVLWIRSVKKFKEDLQTFSRKMITNVQILTEDEEVINATVESDRKITAAYQNLRKVPHAVVDVYGHWVEILDLSHNNLRDVEELSMAFSLHTLILDHNLLSSDSYFPWMPQLRVLWLNNNLVFNLKPFIPALSRACPNLVYLSLMGNRGSSSMVMGGSEHEQDKYRLYVISHFDHLRHLDDKPVTSIERLRCEKRDPTIVDNLLSIYYEFKDAFTFKIGKKSSCVV